MAKTIHHFFPNLSERIQDTISDPRATSVYSITEIIIAAIAMFLLKQGSRNALNQSKEEGNFQKNYRKIFKCNLPHMDTVNEVLRSLDEESLESLSKSLIQTLIKQKIFHKFRLFQKYYRIAVDATGVYSFNQQHCEKCLTRTSKKGKTTYFHNVLEAKLIASNGFSISLGTEWIENPSADYDKQDCELKAFKRLAARIKKDYPRLPICIVADGLYPNAPFFNICESYGWMYICAFQDGNLSSIQQEVELLLPLNLNQTGAEKIIRPNKSNIDRSFRWLSEIDYQEHSLHWVECIEKVSEKQTRFVYLTNISITQKNFKNLVETGRMRQKIENEGFNTQKNLGYDLQHKYSRVSFTATKNYYQCLQIAHLFNQLLELSQSMKENLISWGNTLKHCWKCIWGFMVECELREDQLELIFSQRMQFRY